MKRLLAGFTLGLALCSPLAAQTTPQVFIRNAPFPAVAGPEGAVVQFEPFVRTLGYEIHTRGEILEILAPGDEACPTEHPPGLYFQHEAIAADVVAGTARLELLAGALGARVVTNAATGTVDVYPAKPRSKNSAVAAAPFQALCFLSEGQPPSQLTRSAPSLNASFGLEVVPVHIRGPRYATYSRYWQTGALPLTVLVDGSGRILGQWSGIPAVAEITRLCEQRVAQRRSTNGQRASGRAGGRASFSGVGGGGGGG